MIFDGHSDIFTDVTRRRLAGETQVIRNHHMDRLRRGGLDASCFVIWIDQPCPVTPEERLGQMMQCIKDEMAECREAVIVHSRRELEDAVRKGLFAILIGVEGLSGAGSDIEKIDALYEFGARHVGLTWNEQNAFGTGVQGDPGRGLTDLGRAAVRRIQDLGMLMDVSHLNVKSFWDVVDEARGPIVASHSNAWTLSNAARNLNDDQLRAIRDLDGIVGLNSFNLFVSQEIPNQDLDHLVKHAVYIAEKVGVDHLGFGFDFFEFLSADSMASYSDQDTSFTVGFEDCSKIPVLVQKLREAGFSESELEQIAWGNWMKVIEKSLRG